MAELAIGDRVGESSVVAKRYVCGVLAAVSVAAVSVAACTKREAGPNVATQPADALTEPAPVASTKQCSRPQERVPWFCAPDAAPCPAVVASKPLILIARGPGMSGWNVPELVLSARPAPPPLPRASIMETNRTWLTLTDAEMARAYAWLGTIAGGVADHRLLTARLVTDQPKERRVGLTEVYCALAELAEGVKANARARAALDDYLERLRRAAPP